jgi:MOSC domain-containing protein YiiM
MARLFVTDIWRAETRGRQTCGKSISSRANCSMRCKIRVTMLVSGISAKTFTTAGVDLETSPLNTELHMGASVNIRLTGLRTPCILIDRFKSGLKGRLLDATPNPPFRAGIMAVVSEGGEISPGDPIRATLPRAPSPASSSAVNSLRRGAFSRLQDRGFPVASPRA